MIVNECNADESLTDSLRWANPHGDMLMHDLLMGGMGSVRRIVIANSTPLQGLGAECVVVNDTEAGDQVDESPGVFAAIGALPAGTLITEPGLAKMLGKCTASIKAAVERGELPRPARLMGKNTWSIGSIIRHHEARMEAEGRKFRQLRG